MNFDTINNEPCIPGTGSGANGTGTPGNPIDPRCSDAAFAAANPTICAQGRYLILKPASSIIATLGSVQFNTFLYQNGVETLLTSGLLFGSSDTTIFVIGASSGNGTGLKPGQVVVTVTYQGYSATATVTVVDSTIGCSQTVVATAILIDDSLSMSLSFGGSYRTLLDAAKAFANAWAGNILQVNGQPKDSVSIFSFDDTPNQISTGFIADTSLLAAQINGVSQSQGDTDLLSALQAAITALQQTTATEQVILLITDGIQTDAPTEQDILTAASAFTGSGGIIICIGIRAALGFDLLERLATGGFFINATPSNVSDSMGGLSYLKSAVCAGQCFPAGDYYAAEGQLDYSSLKNWSVISGQLNLLGNGFIDLLPGNGLYLQLAEDNNPATIQSIDEFTLNTGDVYELSFSLAGNNETFTPTAGQAVHVYVQDVNSGQNLLDHVLTPVWNAGFQTFAFNFTAQYAATVRIYFQQEITSGFTGNFAGDLLDNIVFRDTTTLVTLLSDNFDDENITYIPPACGPSAALPEVGDPSIPSLMFINYANGSQISSETYKYAVSLKTQQGETNLSTVASTATLAPVAFPNQATLLSNLGLNLAADPLDRIISIRIWRNDASASGTLYLLAEIAPESVNYVDLEDHAQFAARVDPSIVPPASNTTAVAQGELAFGVYGCYQPVCEPQIAVGIQMSDANPLPNIESPGTGGTQFTSTQQACGTCPNGVDQTQLQAARLCPESFANFDSGPPAPNDVSADTACLTAPGTVAAYSITILQNSSGGFNYPTAWEFQGSNDQNTWTTLDTQTNGFFSAGRLSAFTLSAPATYQYFRIMVTAFANNLACRYQFPISLYTTPVSQIQANQQVCKSATASSFISQQDADAKATAAAQALLTAYQQANCLGTFTSTKSYTANCPCGQLGSPVTKTATYVSLISQQDADAQALALAKAQAISALSCNNSNNGQQIVVPLINGATQSNEPATQYPSVQVITGFVGNSSKVTVAINGYVGGTPGYLNQGDLGACDLLLVSPTGKTCLLKAGSPANGLHLGNNAAWSVTFDDAAATTIPQNSLPNNPGVYKPTQTTPGPSFPGCVSGEPYGTTLANVAGDSPNGSWSLWCRSPYVGVYPTSIASWSLTIT